MGALIASRRSNPIAWLLSYIALVSALFMACTLYAQVGLSAKPERLPAASLVNWIAGWVFYLAFPCAFGFLIFLYPDGRLPSPRWRLLGWFGALAVALKVVGGLTAPVLSDSPVARPNPASLGALGDTLDGISWLAAMIFVAASGVALAVRTARARGDERQQMKWLALCAGVLGVAALLDFGGYMLGSPNLITAALATFLLSAALIPVSTAVAVLKYRLYDIDLVLNRAVLYGSLAVLVTALYAAVVVGVGALLGARARGNFLLPVIATMVIAIGFEPARRRLQGLANRLVYGHRESPYDVLARFAQQFALDYDRDRVLQEMARRLGQGTGAVRAEVWLRIAGSLKLTAVWSRTSAPADQTPELPVDGAALPALPGDKVVAVRYLDELLGALTVTKRRGEELRPSEEKLVDDLAQQAALMLKNIGLTSELLQRLEELRASRQRLVTAQDDERRRLERDLHDGAQQHLVALKVQLGLAGHLAEAGSPLQAMLIKLTADADEALATLRDLAHGIYPPLLSERGIAAALRSHVQKATVSVRIESDGVGRYPPELEAALYFCCLEALQNVQKYAEARNVIVNLRERDHQVEFEVVDDGKGFEAAAGRAGAGTQNMSDRLESLGGRLTVISRPGSGTRVSGVVPLAPATDHPGRRAPALGA